MYQAGAQVLYGVHGICNIVSIEPMRFGKTKADYYCLQPIIQPDARYYVPVNNEAAVAKMRPLMDRQNILDLLHSEEVCNECWIPEENQRKLRYRELLASGNRGELLQMIYTLHLQKKQVEQIGKKFHQCDESFLRDAERLLHSEFGYVLDLKPEQVTSFIIREMGIDQQ